MLELLTHPAFSRALTVGVFGGVGLVLLSMLSRRGPLVFPVYAAILASLAVLLARYPAMAFPLRLGCAFGGFTVAGVIHYISVGIAANRDRRRRGAPPESLSVAGHSWRLAFLLGTGLLASAGVAFIAS